MLNGRLSASALVAILMMAGSAFAATCGNSAKGFDGFIKSVRAEAASTGIAKPGIAALDGVKYDPTIIKKDRAQNVFSQSFLEFQGRMVTDYRIKQGKVLNQQHKVIFTSVQQQYGVPAPVLIAIDRSLRHGITSWKTYC